MKYYGSSTTDTLQIQKRSDFESQLGVINVQSDFGATGDGSTDDTTAIQNAINSSTNGQIILFPPGTYRITSTLSLPGGRKYMGTHREHCVIKQGDGANLNAVVASEAWLDTGGTAYADSPTYINSITIDGNRTNQASGDGYGIALLAFWSLLDDVLVTNARGDGYHITSARNDDTEIPGTAVEVMLNRCDARNIGGHGIHVYDPSDSVQSTTDGIIRDCMIQDCNLSGIHITASAGWLVDGNHIYGVQRYGINCNRTYATRIRGNYVEYWGLHDADSTYYAAIAAGGLGGTSYMAGSEPSLIIGNNVTDTTAHGTLDSRIRACITTGSANGVDGYASIVGNSLSGSTATSSYGIWIDNQGSTSSTVAYCSGNALSGFSDSRVFNGQANGGDMQVVIDGRVELADEAAYTALALKIPHVMYWWP